MAKPAIILVNPQMGENIGMVARAMLNFGLTELRLVNPRDGWPNVKAVATASGASHIIDSAQIFETTREAVADLTYVYATTARGRDMVKHIHTPATAATRIQEQETQGHSAGILFGAERTGLENDDIAMAEAIITYPTNPDFSSLNLAQAVLLMSYELHKTEDDTQAKLQKGHGTAFATKEVLNRFLARLNDDLEAAAFFKTKEMKPSVQRNIESLFVRANLTEQEVNTLYGIVKALKKRNTE